MRERYKVTNLKYISNITKGSGGWLSWKETKLSTEKISDTYSNSNNFIETVYSTNKEAYPEYNHVDEFWYISGDLG